MRASPGISFCFSDAGGLPIGCPKWLTISLQSTPKTWRRSLTLEIGVYRLTVGRRGTMAKLALIYGMRLLPVDDLGEVKEATVVLKNGRTARVAMHLIEGSKEEIEETFKQSVEAFFEMYPEI
jgi:hypothetical protein